MANMSWVAEGTASILNGDPAAYPWAVVSLSTLWEGERLGDAPVYPVLNARRSTTGISIVKASASWDI